MRPDTPKHHRPPLPLLTKNRHHHQLIPDREFRPTPQPKVFQAVSFNISYLNQECADTNYQSFECLLVLKDPKLLLPPAGNPRWFVAGIFAR
jgi:hypothetical protein